MNSNSGIQVIRNGSESAWEFLGFEESDHALGRPWELLGNRNQTFEYVIFGPGSLLLKSSYQLGIDYVRWRKIWTCVILDSSHDGWF